VRVCFPKSFASIRPASFSEPQIHGDQWCRWAQDKDRANSPSNRIVLDDPIGLHLISNFSVEFIRFLRSIAKGSPDGQGVMLRINFQPRRKLMAADRVNAGG
jgi:hypothetical protein